MKATWWARTRMFVDRHAMKIALALVVAVAVGAVAGLRWEGQQRDEKVEAEAEQRAADFAAEQLQRTSAIEAAAEERRSQICTESRNLRALVSELIDTAVGEAATSGLPLTTLDSFDALPETVQTYLRELAAAMATDDPSDEPDLATRLRTFQATRLGELPAFCT